MSEPIDERSPCAETAARRVMDLGRLKRLTSSIPDDAELHGYLHSWGVTVQAEWVADYGECGREIMNPVILRIPFEISAGGAVTEPEWASWYDQSAEGEAAQSDGYPATD